MAAQAGREKAQPLLLGVSWLALLASSSAVSPLASRTDALALTNHPLSIQLGTGKLPYGSLTRCLLARTALLDALTASVEAACADSRESPPAQELLSLMRAEHSSSLKDADTWLAAAASAGKSIELPESEIRAGVRCYICGGTHYNTDCPQEAKVPSTAAQGLATYLRGAATFGAVAAVLLDLAFAFTTLRAAGLDGGDAFGQLVAHHNDRLPQLAAAVELAAQDESGALRDAARAQEEAGIARSLLYAWVDGEAGEAGLQDVAEGTAMSLQEARERVDTVEPGFLQAQDRNAQFLRDEVLGATTSAGSPDSAALQDSPAQSKKAAVDAAAAYLAARKAQS